VQNRVSSNISLKWSRLCLAAGIMLVSVISSAADAAAGNADFESRRANAKLLAASTPAECNSAARTLGGLIRKGVRNAPLFYDYGTMLLAAGHPKEAYNAFIRAERYAGTDWDIRHNMLAALAKSSDGPAAPRLPWYRVPLFWHYKPAARTRLTIASAAFLSLCLALLLRRFHRPEPYRFLLAISVATLVLFGSSALTTIYQETHSNLLATDTLPAPRPVTHNTGEKL